jgi:hypothetical protein
VLRATPTSLVNPLEALLDLQEDGIILCIQWMCLVRPRFSAGYRETSVALLGAARGILYTVAYINPSPSELKGINNYDLLG